MTTFGPVARALRASFRSQTRRYSASPTPKKPRHLLSIKDLTPLELSRLIVNGSKYARDGLPLKKFADPSSALRGGTVALLFSKRSTRTRVSTEAAVAAMNGHAMFLGKDDIQLGVNESFYDTSVVISSMVSSIFARVNRHSEVAALAKDSSVPVINSLCDQYHPLQTVADYITIVQAYGDDKTMSNPLWQHSWLTGLRIAWIGDANNVLFDMCIAARKLGVTVAVATPKGYEIPPFMRDIIEQAGSGVEMPGEVIETNVPEEAIKDAGILVTDTWVSMGQEEEKAKRLRDFEGFQITSELAKRGGAKNNWKFMHCLPRHQEEVSDEVFYSPRSLVFTEAQNRLFSAVSVLEGFVVNKGEIRED